MENFDIVIVGNGILGLSIAYAIAEEDPSLNIGIIGPHNRLGSGTVAAGAMLNCFAEVTHRTLTSIYGRSKFNMATSALKMWPAWIDHINSALPTEKKIAITPGAFVILNARSGQLDSDNYAAIMNALEEYKEPYEEIEPRLVPDIKPTEDCRPLRSLYLPNEGSINASSMLSALEFILARNPNVTFINEQAKKLNAASGKIHSVETTSQNTLAASIIIVAAGAYSQSLIEQLPDISDLIPRIVAGVGYSILLQKTEECPINHVIRTPNRAGACGLHILPRDAQTLYVGASNNVNAFPQTMPQTGLIHFIMGCVMEQINQALYKANFLGWHVGNRAATIDAFPLIGETSIKGLWLMTGTYRDGFHQSPLLSRHIAAQALGKPGLFDNIFMPERIPFEIFTKEEAIEEYITHYIAGTYEHRAQLPKFLPDKDYASVIRYKIQNLYERLDTDVALTPDMLLMFEFAPEQDKLIASYKEYFSKITSRKKNFSSQKMGV